MKALRAKLDLQIVQRYALASLFATMLIAIHYLVNTLKGNEAYFGLELQAYSIAVLGVILVTSVMGAVFHQLKLEPRERNSYALIFAGGVTKLVLTLVACQMLVN